LSRGGADGRGYKARNLPVKKETDGTSDQLETGKRPGSMDRVDRINGFVFDESLSVNQEISPISTIKHGLSVADREIGIVSRYFAGKQA
jgi:hypothetical protein